MRTEDSYGQRVSETARSESEYLINIPPREVYRLAVEHFSKMPDVRISKKREPSQIVLEIGSLTSTELGNERGSVKIQIDEVEGRSQVFVEFSFVIPYVVSAVYWFLVWLILISGVSLLYPGIWQLAFLYNNVLVFLTIVLVGFGVGYSVGKTKERFVPRLNMFFRTLEYRRAR